MVGMIKPSDVKKAIMRTPWQKSEKDIIAINILGLSRFKNKDEWKPFTWDDYVEFCSHNPTHSEKEILEEFVSTGYLRRDAAHAYHFENKIIGVYMQYSE